MAFRNTILVVETGKEVARRVDRAVREMGYYTMRVEKPDTFLPLLDSLDRIRALLFVDDGSAGAYGFETLKLLKRSSHDLPLVYSTADSTPEKEKQVRKLGIFFYHIADSGLESLVTSLGCAVEKSIREEVFLTP